MIRPCKDKHNDIYKYVDTCPFCRMAATSVDIQQAWANDKPSFPLVPCVSLGDPATIREIQDAGLSPFRLWQHCEKDFGENGLVCRCSGCGPLCDGYELPKTLDTL